jgi:phosphatidylserine/phosphatidylglycerophosphate/cardiolipin synthase-like enzyme
VSQALLSRAPSELRALAGAIRMGRLSAPFSALAVKQIMNDDADSVTHSLAEMAECGMPAAGIAHTLELLASALADRPRIEDQVQLVATGPEVSGVANRDTSVVVSDLFTRAAKSVVVIGYAVYQGQRVFQSLAARMNERPELRVRMYLDIPRKPGDTTIESELVRRFCHQFRKTQWPSSVCLPEIYYDPRSTALDRDSAASLHAKCVVADGRDVFVSSANFTEAGQTKNIELGVLVSSPVLAERIAGFFEQLVEERFLTRAL